MRYFRWLSLIAVFLLVRFASADVAAERQAMLEGVTSLSAPGALPGSLAVTGENAFVVLTARQGKVRMPLVAAAIWGKGRIVALGHEAFIGQAVHDKQNERFIENCVSWAARGGLFPQTLRVGTFEPDALSALRSHNADAVLLPPEDLDAIETRLTNLDVLYLDQGTLDGRPNAIQAVRRWIERDGGGVILAGPGWGWAQVTGKDLAREQSAGLICRDAGIAWTEGTLEATGKDGAYLADAEGVENAHAGNALERLARHATGKRTLPPEILAQVTQVVAEATSALPGEDTKYIPRVATLCDRYAGTVVPTHEKPITPADTFARLKVVLASQAERRLPPEKIPANPAADSFPGRVPKEAPRVKREVMVESVPGGWCSTGLYAAPGEVVTVTIPQDQVKNGLAVRIGAHTDTLWNLEKWERWPDISRRRPLTRATVRLASPFGGAIYIEAPETAPKASFVATIGDAVTAPLFVRGRTTTEEWRTARLAPAPWAELVGRRVALTLPADAVRTLEDPDALMAHWDEVMDACAAFYAVPEDERRPQRYCVDRQIAAGYMHSGYPIMAWEDVTGAFVDLSVLRGKDGLKVWGFYHELGHNHQKPEWTWDGCGEVTNNLFSLYGNEKFNGVSPEYTTSHPAMRPEERQKRLKTYLANGARYDDWKADPFLALTFFAQLRQAFGWEPFTRVFAEYEALSATERPKTDEQKRDQFLVRFSRAVGKNLGPYFLHWGVPTTEEARQKVQSLTIWLPPEFSAAP